MSISLTGSQSPIAASRALSREAAFAFIAGAAVFAALLWLPVVLRDPDTLWHITTGAWIMAHHAVPTVDTYSFTKAGHRWFAQEWLSEVLLALAYGWRGWAGVMILTALAAGGTVGLVAFYVRSQTRTDIAMMLVALTVACGGGSVLSRPHMIALPLMALWTIGLVSARGHGRAPSLALLPVMTVWANLHGGFLLGLVLAAALGLEAVFDPACDRRESIRGWGRFVLLAVAAAAVTPRGVMTLVFPFQLMSMKTLYQIQEWKPTDFSHLDGMTVTILVGLYMGLTGSLRLPRFRVLLVAGLVFSVMQHVRNAQLFGVVVPLLIAGSIGPAGALQIPRRLRLPEWLPFWVVATAAAVSLVVRIAMPVERVDEFGYASAALAAVPADLRAKPVLNEYGFGGLLIFDGVKPFIDGRADLYGDKFLGDYLSIVHSKSDMLDEMLCRYGIQWTMFSPGTAVPALMDRTPGWHRLYSDKVAVIHVRDSAGVDPICPAKKPR